MRPTAALLVLALLPACNRTGPPRRDGPGTLDTADSGTPGPITASNEVGTLIVEPALTTVVTATFDMAADADETWVSWTVDGEERRSPAVPRVAGEAATVALLGTPADTSIEPVLHVVVEGVETTAAFPEITTGSLPPGLITPTLTASADGARPEPWTLLSVDVGQSPFFGPWFAIIVDDQGRIVWYRLATDRRLTWQAATSRGHVVLDTTNTYSRRGPDSLTRLTLDLRQEEEIVLPDFHFAWQEMPDGGFVYGTGGGDRPYDLVRRHPDGTDEVVWQCLPWVEPWLDHPEVWPCAVNTIRFDEARGTYLYSMFESDTVLEISSEGQIVRELGRFPGGIVAVPATADLDHQHLPNWTSEGTLILQTDTPGVPGEQWVREYEVTDEAFSVVFELPSNHFAEYGGHAQRLASGHILWGHGTAGVVEELTREGEVVWAIDFGPQVIGNVTPVADLYALNEGF